MPRSVKFVRSNTLPLTPLTKGDIYHVVDVNLGSIQVCNDNNKCAWYPESYFSTVEHKPTRPPLVPHKHAAIIKAWADGASIQYLRTANNKWYPVHWGDVHWSTKLEYRVKPDNTSEILFAKGLLQKANKELAKLEVKANTVDSAIVQVIQKRSDLILKLQSLES